MGDESDEQCFFVGDWLIKQGREQEFKTVWEDFVHWTLESKHGEGQINLFQDLAEPRRFYALWKCGPEQTVEKWTRETRYKEFVMRMRAFCENCSPSIAVPVRALRPGAGGTSESTP